MTCYQTLSLQQHSSSGMPLSRDGQGKEHVDRCGDGFPGIINSRCKVIEVLKRNFGWLKKRMEEVIDEVEEESSLRAL